MIPLPPRSTRTYTLFPSTPPFRSLFLRHRHRPRGDGAGRHLGDAAASRPHPPRDHEAHGEGVRVMAASRKIRLIMELRRSGIADTEVPSAVERILREMFTHDSFRNQAYETMAIPIGQGQTLSQPKE